MNMNKLTQRSADALNYAQQLAMSESHPQIEPMHLLSALLHQEDGLVGQILKKTGIDLEVLRKHVDEQLKLLPRQEGGQIYPSREMPMVFSKAEAEANQLKDEFISVEHLLLGILEVKCKAREILIEYGVKRDDILKALAGIRGTARVTDDHPESKYQVLEKYSRDLTQLARDGKLDPVIGREDEIKRNAQMLRCRLSALIQQTEIGVTVNASGP